LHRTRLAKLEFLHASRIATFGFLGFGLLAAGASSAVGGLRLSVVHKGIEYSETLELSPIWDALLLLGGILCVAIVIHALARMERSQDRIIEMKLKSDDEAEAILKYEYEDYRRERDLRFAIDPILMAVSLLASNIFLAIWVNEVIIEPATAAILFYLGIALGGLSVLDQAYLWFGLGRERDKE
jgi:hypothetical protein